MGTMYVWTFGDLTAKNLKTGDTCRINFFEKGWTSSNDFKAEGECKDSNGEVKYNIWGLWNKDLHMKEKATGQETLVCTKLTQIEKQDWQYMFAPISLQMN